MLSLIKCDKLRRIEITHRFGENENTWDWIGVYDYLASRFPRLEEIDLREATSCEVLFILFEF